MADVDDQFVYHGPPEFMGKMSMREKSLYKKKVTREHNSNFQAGYVYVDKCELYKTGLRGRKRWFLILLVAGIALLTMINFAINTCLLIVLKIQLGGSDYIRFNQSNHVLKFMKDVNANFLMPYESVIQPLHSNPLTVTGYGNKVDLSIDVKNSSFVRLNSEDGILVKTDEFILTDPRTGLVYFSTDYRNYYNLPMMIQNVKFNKSASSSKVESPRTDHLSLHSSKKMFINGKSGIDVSAQSKIYIVMRGNLAITAKEQVRLNGKNGIYWKSVDNVGSMYSRDYKPSKKEAYQICICLPSGKLFMVPGSCKKANEITNPCK